MRQYKTYVRQKSNTRKRIVEEACQMIKTVGPESFTVQELISKLSISVGTFYYYFESKEALLYQTLIYLDEQFVHSYEEKYKNLSSCSLKLKMFLHEQALVASRLTPEHLDNYRLVIKTELLTYYFNARVSPKYQLLIKIVEEGREIGEFTQLHQTNELAEMIWTIMAGIADFFRISDLYNIVERADSLSETIIDLIQRK